MRNLTFAAGCLALLGACGGADSDARMAADPMARPEMTRSLLEAAAAAEAQNDFASAAGYYRNIATHDPNNVRALVGLMQNLRALGAQDDARDVADKALAARPNDPAIAAEAGKVRLASGRLQEAIVLLQRAAELDPQDWKSRSALGVAYDRLGNSKRAEESYQAALKISPENVAILNNQALSRAMAGDLVGARELLQHAVATGTADQRVRQNLALVYALSGDMAQAEALTLRDMSPDAARATLAYYRDLAARAKATSPAEALPQPQP